jgi:predicted DsbA family dithiol-disulfide isomerase
VPALRVEVWSDVACPWCWIGKRRLEAAIARLPPGAGVEVVYRSFELDPTARPAARPRTTYAQRLARKYRTTVEQAQATIDRMVALGRGEGLDLRFDRVRPANTFDAHRVLHLARERGLQGAVKERLLRAYFSEGEPLGDRGVLARLAADAGLDAAEVRRALEGDAHAAAVRADEEEAAGNGVHAVPFFVLGGEYAVAGAQPADVLHGALAQALAAARPAT